MKDCFSQGEFVGKLVVHWKDSGKYIQDGEDRLDRKSFAVIRARGCEWRLWRKLGAGLWRASKPFLNFFLNHKSSRKSWDHRKKSDLRERLPESVFVCFFSPCNGPLARKSTLLLEFFKNLCPLMFAADWFLQYHPVQDAGSAKNMQRTHCSWFLKMPHLCAFSLRSRISCLFYV